MKEKKRLLNILRILVGISILLLLILKLGTSEVMDIILNIDVRIFIIVLLSLLAVYLLFALNIKILLAGMGEEIGTASILRYYLPSHAIGLLTPGRIGRFSLLYFLEKKKIPYGKTLAALVVDRLITYITLSVIAIYGFFIFFEKAEALEITIFVLLLLFASIFLVESEKTRKIIRDFVLKKYAEKFEGFYHNLEFLVKTKKLILILVFFISFIRLVLAALVKYFMFLYFDVIVSFSDVLIINSISSLTALIPISISGLGIMEGSAVYLFYRIGVEPAVAGGIFLFVTFVRYLIASIILGIYGSEIKVLEFKIRNS